MLPYHFLMYVRSLEKVMTQHAVSRTSEIWEVLSNDPQLDVAEFWRGAWWWSRWYGSGNTTQSLLTKEAWDNPSYVRPELILWTSAEGAVCFGWTTHTTLSMVRTLRIQNRANLSTSQLPKYITFIANVMHTFICSTKFTFPEDRLWTMANQSVSH